MIYRQVEFANLCGISRGQLGTEIKRGNVVKLPNGKVDASHELNAAFLMKYTRSVEPEDNGESLWQIDRRKRNLEVKKVTEEIELLRIKKEKLQGILIPTELVKLVFIRYSKSISSAFNQAADNYLTEIAHMKQMSSKELSEWRKKLTDVTNKAIDESITDSKKAIKNIVMEYSEARGRGERK